MEKCDIIKVIVNREIGLKCTNPKVIYISNLENDIFQTKNTHKSVKMNLNMISKGMFVYCF